MQLLCRRQARTLQPLRLSCREKVLPTDCMPSETDIVQGENKRKMKGLGLLFLLLPSDCCIRLPTVTWEAVICRADRTHDHWPTEKVQQSCNGKQSCVLCLECLRWHKQTGKWQAREAGAGEGDRGEAYLAPPAGRSFLGHTHMRSSL